MKYAIGAIIATVCWALLFSFIPAPEGRIYDCSITEFHPDIPPKVKEECRKKRMQNRKDTLTI
jgi:hypothetical protein